MLCRRGYKRVKNKNIVYCSQRKCPNTSCLRHNVNTPFNVEIKRTDFKPDKDWKCKGGIEGI